MKMIRKIRRKITRKITSTALARVCGALLLPYIVLAALVRASQAPVSYGILAPLAPVSNGILAPLLAANAVAALCAGLVFNEPKFSHCTSKGLRLIVAFIGVVSGLLSALFWLEDAVDRSWVHVVLISPVLVFLLMLSWFVHKADKGPKHEGE